MTINKTGAKQLIKMCILRYKTGSYFWFDDFFGDLLETISIAKSFFGYTREDARIFLNSWNALIPFSF